MKYLNGETVHLGDKVRLWEGVEGTIICSIDTKEYSEAYPEIHWAYLKKGVMIDTPKLGLFHYEEADEDFELLVRNLENPQSEAQV